MLPEIMRRRQIGGRTPRSVTFKLKRFSVFWTVLAIVVNPIGWTMMPLAFVFSGPLPWRAIYARADAAGNVLGWLLGIRSQMFFNWKSTDQLRTERIKNRRAINARGRGAQPPCREGVGRGAFNSRFDEIARDQGERDRHIHFADAAAFTIRNALDAQGAMAPTPSEDSIV